MGRRSNNGYIGRDFQTDIKGVVDLNKRNLTRFFNDELTYNDPGFYFTGIPFVPSASLYALGVSNFGSGSAVSASLVSGTLANVTIYNGGTSYGTSAVLSFSGGGGTGANGYVSGYSAGALFTVERLGYIKDIVITDPGEGYTSAPTMTVSAPVTANGVAGVTAIISASITNGQLTGYTIHNTGSNYRAGTNWPTITFTGGGATRAAAAVPVLEFGRNYTSNPTVTVTGAGSGAVVSASIVGVLSPTGTVTAAGGGYSSAPTIDIPATNDTVSASATLNAGTLNAITIVTGSATIHVAPDVNVGGELSYPALNNNEIYGTYAVYNNNSNWVAFNVSTNGGGGYTVDWGDGTTNNYNTNVTASKQYTTSSYAALSSSLYNGAKLALVKITLSGSATSLATVDLTRRPTPTTGSFPTSLLTTNQWLSIAAAGTNISSFTVGSPTIGQTTSGMLERFYFSGSNQITSFNSMFNSCFSLKEVTELFMGSATGTTAFQSMFSGCRQLVKIPVMNINNTAAVLTSMFLNCNNLPSVTFVSSSNVTGLSNTFNSCLQLQTINGFDFTSPTLNDLTNTFANCLSLTSLPPINVTNVVSLNSTFSGCGLLTSIKFIGTTSKVTNFSATFSGCYSLVDIPKEFDCRSTTGLGQTFTGCRSLRESPVFYNTTAVNTVTNLFQNCSQLKKVNLFDTRAVTNFTSTFAGCTLLTTIPRFNTSRVTLFTSTFSSCPLLKTIPLLNTANATDFSSTFNGCTSLVSIPPINTSKGTTFSNTFTSCPALTKIPYLNTGNGTDFSSMFNACTSLTEVPTLNTSNAGTMSNMFLSCQSLKRVPNFNIPNCTTIASMFQGCTMLTDAPTFYNANKVTDATGMYASCTNLRRVPGMGITSFSSITNMFNGCSNLIEVGNIQCPAASLINTVTTFSNCGSLKRMGITNINASFQVINCSLDSNALNEIYTNLSATGAGKTIQVTNNWGTANDNPSIATAKGWTVTG